VGIVENPLTPKNEERSGNGSEEHRRAGHRAPRERPELRRRCLYKGSTVDYSVVKARELRDGEILAHVSGKLHVSEGPLAGDHEAIGTVVLVPDDGEHRIAAYHNTLVAG
jgi:hypothetical protein